MENNLKVRINNGNIKVDGIPMGGVPSVSLPACITCNPEAPCFQLCYARRVSARHKRMADGHENNLKVLRADPATYWAQVREAVSAVPFFRFHVSGDIPDAEYMTELARTAEMFPGTVVLVFTKQYSFVNGFVDAGGVIPGNLHIIFRLWDAEWNAKIDNHHNFPTFGVIFDESEVKKFTGTCPGNCMECARGNTGCWGLKSGESIGIFEQ
ncbi:MAG: hypothetical protein HUJ66_08235 [Oscillospiraceae bacterium]|nr:hypothetical protein [Oscillospiraceae bacterium]